ncbi:MAG: AsmA family protein [Gammaproteobacteria bacterium]|nr:AsmA family protein [Gammaproteobacteria bacterium]
MKILRVIGIIVLAIVLLCVLLVIGAKLWINPNKLKPRIEAEVRKNTGLVLKIDGDLAWTFYPVMGMSAPHLTLSLPKATPFVEFNHVVIKTSLAQLFNRQVYSGELKIGATTLDRLRLSNASVGFKISQGRLTLAPIKASLYNGALSGSIEANNFNTMPKWNWNLQARAVQLKPLLIDVNGENSKIQISGLGNINLKATSIGTNRLQFIQNLQGQTNVNVEQGKLEGVNLNYLIQTADALLNRQAVGNEPTTANETVFDRLTGTGLIQNGLITTKDLTLAAKTFTAQAQGNISLLLDTLQFHLQIASTNVLKSQWTIPVAVTGRISQPTVQVDLDSLQKLLVSDGVDKLKESAYEKIKTRVSPQAQQLLQNMLSR